MLLTYIDIDLTFGKRDAVFSFALENRIPRVIDYAKAILFLETNTW